MKRAKENKRKRTNGNRRIRSLSVLIGILIILTISSNFFKVYAKETPASVSEIIYIKNTTEGMKIKWQDVDKAAGYIVYRSISDNKYKKIEDVKTKKYVDTDLETGERYQYKVKPYHYVGKKKVYGKKSRASAVCVALPEMPFGVNMIDMTGYMTLSWKINPLASGYDIYRSTDNIVWEPLDSVNGDIGIYSDYSIESGKEYFYKVSTYEIVDGKKYSSDFVPAVKVTEQKGIDVSYHNGKIRWKKVKQNGIHFAMIRLGYGTSKAGVIDSKFDYNMKEARKYGIKTGVYFYSYADNVKEARNEARFVLKVLKRYGKTDYPVVFDFENTYRNKKKYKKSNTKIIQTFCDEVEKEGHDVMVYSYEDFLKKSVNYKKISSYGIWLAKWTHNSEIYDDCGIPNVQLWQYSDRGQINGIDGNVDVNLNILL